MIRPSNVAVTPALMVKSEKLLELPPPLMVTPGVPIDPGCEPSMVTFLQITSDEARSIVVTLGAKLMMSPAAAAASAARSEPAPLSLLLVTVMVAIVFAPLGRPYGRQIHSDPRAAAVTASGRDTIRLAWLGVASVQKLCALKRS